MGSRRSVHFKAGAGLEWRHVHNRLAKLGLRRVKDGVALKTLEEKQRARGPPVGLVDCCGNFGRLALGPANLPRAHAGHAWRVLWVAAFVEASREDRGALKETTRRPCRGSGGIWERTTPSLLPTTTSAVNRIRLPPFVT